jgi:PilZ domain
MVPRYAFVATTEITDSLSAMKLLGRVAEISRKGCSVDILNALPVGTLLDLRISREHGTFVTKGKTIYVQERIGMGVVFLDPPEDQLQILDSWLADLPPTACI